MPGMGSGKPQAYAASYLALDDADMDALEKLTLAIAAEGDGDDRGAAAGGRGRARGSGCGRTGRGRGGRRGSTSSGATGGRAGPDVDMTSRPGDVAQEGHGPGTMGPEAGPEDWVHLGEAPPHTTTRQVHRPNGEAATPTTA